MVSLPGVFCGAQDQAPEKEKGKKKRVCLLEGSREGSHKVECRPLHRWNGGDARGPTMGIGGEGTRNGREGETPTYSGLGLWLALFAPASTCTDCSCRPLLAVLLPAVPPIASYFAANLVFRHLTAVRGKGGGLTCELQANNAVCGSPDKVSTIRVRSCSPLPSYGTLHLECFNAMLFYPSPFLSFFSTS